MVNNKEALVVFSGGQDSTTCLFWAKKHFEKVYALSFLYGQKHEKEVELAREIARKVGWSLKSWMCHYRTPGKLSDGYVYSYG